jgi:hypothetical protein
MTNRHLLVLGSAVVLIAVGLLALNVPVFINRYDQFGSQVNCGNGFSADLGQASIADHGGTDPQAGGPAVTRAASEGDFVAQCQLALSIRRSWAIPTAAIGWLIFTALVMTWVRQEFRTGATGFAAPFAAEDPSR